VLLFFKGCGVAPATYADLAAIVRQDRDSITKYEIVRRILQRLNDKGDGTLAQRREVLKRVTQWDDFSSCYDNDRMEAKGYVAEIAKLVNVKDSFTRMNQERERVEHEARAKRQSELAEVQRIKGERDQIKTDLYALFAESNASKRGIALEGVLNRLFKSYGILIRESFTRLGESGEGVVEQIDGAIEFDGNIYLVEMKWRSEKLGVEDVSPHLVRVFGRDGARALIISQSGFTDPAVAACQDALAHRVCVLADISEVVRLLDREKSLSEWLRAKVQAAIVDKRPLVQALHGGLPGGR